MIQLNPILAGHIFQKLPLTEFFQGKTHIVLQLRRMVSNGILDWDPETMFDFLINYKAQKSIGPWNDHWDPDFELQRCGLDILCHINTVEAVQFQLNGDIH